MHQQYNKLELMIGYLDIGHLCPSNKGVFQTTYKVL